MVSSTANLRPAPGPLLAPALERLLQGAHRLAITATLAVLERLVPEFRSAAGADAGWCDHQICLRLPSRVATQLDADARSRGMTRSQMVRHRLLLGHVLESEG